MGIRLSQISTKLKLKLKQSWQYCESNEIDYERHFILLCDIFKFKCQCFMSRINVLYSNFSISSIEEQLEFILCPPTIETVKCVSKFRGIMTKTKSEIDAGLNPDDLNLYINHVATTILIVFTRPGYILCYSSLGEFVMQTKKFRKAGICSTRMWHRTLFFSFEEYVQRHVCIVNVPSSLHLNVVFFSLCAHGQCRVYYIYHVEFHFMFRSLVSFPAVTDIPLSK